MPVHGGEGSAEAGAHQSVMARVVAPSVPAAAAAVAFFGFLPFGAAAGVSAARVPSTSTTTGSSPLDGPAMATPPCIRSCMAVKAAVCAAIARSIDVAMACEAREVSATCSLVVAFCSSMRDARPTTDCSITAAASAAAVMERAVACNASLVCSRAAASWASTVAACTSMPAWTAAVTSSAVMPPPPPPRDPLLSAALQNLAIASARRKKRNDAEKPPLVTSMTGAPLALRAVIAARDERSLVTL